MRGDKTHKELLLWELPVVEKTEEARGRSAELVALRNELILYRYIWYALHDGSRMYEWIVKQLVREFWLSESTLSEIIQDNRVLSQQIRKEALTDRQLKEKYAGFEWEWKKVVKL